MKEQNEGKKFVCNTKQNLSKKPPKNCCFGDPVPLVGLVEDAKRNGYVGIYRIK